VASHGPTPARPETDVKLYVHQSQCCRNPNTYLSNKNWAIIIMVCEKLFNEFYIKIRLFSSINKKTYKTIDEILYAFNQL